MTWRAAEVCSEMKRPVVLLKCIAGIGIIIISSLDQVGIINRKINVHLNTFVYSHKIKAFFITIMNIKKMYEYKKNRKKVGRAKTQATFSYNYRYTEIFGWQNLI